MPQVKVENQDLYVIFKEVDDNAVLTSYRLDNGSEVDFFEDDLVQIVLPRFEVSLNRGPLENVPIEFIDIDFINNDFDMAFILKVKIMNDDLNIRCDCSSLMHKI